LVCIAGRNHLLGNDPDFADSGLTQLRGGVSFRLQRVEPGIFARLPLGDNYNKIINRAYGISLKLHF